MRLILPCGGEADKDGHLPADLLGRFAKIDGAKADLAEGNRTPPAPANPFGPSEGADRWEAGNMAKALLGRSDYTDAIKHFQGEVAKDRTGAMPYLAAVHEEMAGKNPELAGKFAMQMGEAGLAMKTDAAEAAREDTLVGGSGEDTTINTSDDTVTVNDNTENNADTTQTNDGNATENGGQTEQGTGDEQVAQGNDDDTTNGQQTTDGGKTDQSGADKPKSQFDLDKAVEKLQSQAHATSGGNCGSYIKSALKAGGLVVGTGIGSAKDMGPALKDAGFTAVDQTSYTPRKGDVVVIQPYLGGNENGHIAMYDGTKWISAFNQRDMWSGPGYRENKPPSQIYRRGS